MGPTPLLSFDIASGPAPALTIVMMVVQGCVEKGRLKKMDWLRRFIMVDIQDAVKVGDVEKNRGEAEIHASVS